MDVQVSEGENAAYRGESEPEVFCFFVFFAIVEAEPEVSVDFRSHHDVERKT